MRQGLTAWQATGAAVGRHQCLVSEAYGALGQREAGLELLAEALAEVGEHRPRSYEAELYRLKGVLLAPRADSAEEAEGSLRRALDIARNQDARGLELRAAVSLNRLCQRQGKQGEARRLLADILASFAEGLDTGDLREARCSSARSRDWWSLRRSSLDPERITILWRDLTAARSSHAVPTGATVSTTMRLRQAGCPPTWHQFWLLTIRRRLEEPTAHQRCEGLFSGGCASGR